MESRMLKYKEDQPEAEGYNHIHGICNQRVGEQGKEKTKAINKNQHSTAYSRTTKNMQKNCEASPGCPKSEPSLGCPESKVYPCKLQEDGGPVGDLPKQKDEVSTHSGGGSVEPASSLSSEPYGPQSEGYYRPMYQQDFCMWSTLQPQFGNGQQNQWNGHESFNWMNHENQIAMANRIQYVPFRMFSQGYLQEFQYQEFQYFVVIDFEATCDKENNPHPQEIIEFPSVLVNSLTGQLEASFQTYVRPMYHQNLSDFCKELTGIQQIQVDRGVSLSEALLMHDKWLEDKGIKQTNFAVVTWSNWDCRVMLESECRFKRIRKPPYFNRWINLKVPFHEVFGGVRCNLKEAVQLAGLAWEGRAHCGLDDARNTARLLAYLMRRGFRFSITNHMNHLMWHAAERPLVFQPPVDRQLLPNHYPHQMKQPVMPLFHLHHSARMDPSKERRIFCKCGLKGSKHMGRRPGQNHASFYFRCGNWTSPRCSQVALCDYFEWASP